MRAWILSTLLVVALVATFNLAEAKPDAELMQAPSSLQDGKDKTGDKKVRKHSRGRGGKHHKDSERRREKRRFRHKKCTSDGDCKHGKKCVTGKKGKICRKEF